MKTTKFAAISAASLIAAGAALIPASFAAETDTFTVDGYTYTFAQCKAGALSQTVTNLDAVTGERGAATGSLFVGYPSLASSTATTKSFALDVRDEATGDSAGCTLTYTKQLSGDVNPGTLSFNGVQVSWPAGATATTATTVKVTPTQLADLKSGIASPGYTGPAQVVGLPQKVANPAGAPADAVTYRVDTKAENGATGSFTVTFTAGEAPAPEPKPEVAAPFESLTVNGFTFTPADFDKDGKATREVEDLDAITGEVSAVVPEGVNVYRDGSPVSVKDEDGKVVSMTFSYLIPTKDGDARYSVTFTTKKAAVDPSAEPSEEPSAEPSEPTAEGTKAAEEVAGGKSAKAGQKTEGVAGGLAKTGAAVGGLAGLAALLGGSGAYVVRRSRRED